MDQQLDDLNNLDRSLFPTSVTVRALRDSRYHNTAYAIAELIDNSVEAGAPLTEVLCKKQSSDMDSGSRLHVTEVAVLDNGQGMDRRTLFEALKFGGGTRHNSPRGIGKYGMGLPTSSMSQCKRVDVWTWTSGLDSAWHSALDADEIEAGNIYAPIPDRQTPIPRTWRAAGSDDIYNSHSGTLVIWSKLDKFQWKTYEAIYRNVSREVGRIHRYYIDADIYRIQTVSFLDIRPIEREVHGIIANDPLYLMQRTSVPEPPWDSEPMFSLWHERDYPVIVDGREETITVKYSLVKDEALRTDRVARFPGATPRGRHARHNIGVSVVREDRELVLEDAFLREGGSSENPQNRWWGCEVHFRRSCDDLFGVDHNKQMVANFTQAARTLLHDERSNQDILDDLNIDDDDLIYTIVGDIRDQTRRLMDQIRVMFANRPSPGPTPGIPPTPAGTAVQTATDADREAVAAGEERPTETDLDRQRISPEIREAALTEQFKELGQADQDAQELARYLVEGELSYQFNSEQLDGYQLFRVRSNHGVLHINLNIDHPVYDFLRHIEDDLSATSKLDGPAFQAIVAIRLLLASWARMEDQTESRDQRMRIQDIAMNWGRHVDKHISQLRERDG